MDATNSILGPCRMRARVSILLALCLLACLFATSSSSQSPASSTPSESTGAGSLFASVISNQKAMEAKLDLYERIQKVEVRKMGGDPTPSEVKVWRVFPSGTGLTRIPLSPDATPISEASYRSDLEKLLKYLEWISQTGSGQRDAYARAERKTKERHELIAATQAAFLFTRVGEEMRGNRLLIKYTMTPNPDYRATTRNGFVFKKVEGLVWIDEQSSELARIEGTVTEDISIAMFLAKVYKGSHFMQERYEVQPGLWAPTFEQYDFDGRKYLLSFNIHERTFFSNYRRVGPPSEAISVVRDELNKYPSRTGSGE